MRLALLFSVAFAALGASVASSGPTPTVACEDVITPTGSYSWKPTRVVLGVVAVPPAYIRQVAPQQEGRWRFSAKAGLVVRADSPPVRVRVPREWLTRVAVGWGGVGATGVLRIASCPPSSSLGDWNPYAGGFYVRRPACVPLTFRVGERERTVRFGVGKRCR